MHRMGPSFSFSTGSGALLHEQNGAVFQFRAQRFYDADIAFG
jgi:hypothetical protein